MNTKEAIDWIKECMDENLSEEYDNRKMLEIIDLLERGEKYEKMWEEFKEEWGKWGMHFYDINADDIVDWAMENLEQKYFPKGEAK